MSDAPKSAWKGPLVADRIALITGGAGAIGTASCAALADHGADIVVADIDGARTAEVVADVERRGRAALGFVGDLTEDGAVDEMMARAFERFGGIDILVNALGHHLSLSGPFEDSTDDAWDRLYRINLRHVMQACRAVIPGMKERGWGHIVNFSSVEGIRSMPDAGAYTAFKGAVDSFTKSIAVELAPSGIRVNCIAVDKTRAHQVNFYDLGQEYERMVPVWIPAGRYAEGSDVASVVLFLASDLSFWVVGQTIPADGGTLAAGGWYRTPNKWTNSPLLLQYYEDPGTTATRPSALR